MLIPFSEAVRAVKAFLWTMYFWYVGWRERRKATAALTAKLRVAAEKDAAKRRKTAADILKEKEAKAKSREKDRAKLSAAERNAALRRTMRNRNQF